MEPIRPERVTESIRPFLGRPSAEHNVFFRGEAAFPGTLAPEDRNYYYHATTLGNLPGILERGLDPGMGGRGGAGEYIAAPVDKKVGDEFVKRDAGFVYLADNAEIAARYAFQYDDQADGFGEPPATGRGNIERAAVILRIRKDVDVLQKKEDSLERDDAEEEDSLERDDAEVEGAYRTTQKLIPSNLEVLTEEGWVPLRDRDLRQDIYNNVNEMLGRGKPRNDLPEDENDIREREARTAGEARPYREETSLEELSGEEGSKRDVGRTTPTNHTEKSYDMSLDLK